MITNENVIVGYYKVVFLILQESKMGTQGYLPPELFSTKKWFIPGENSK